MPDPLRLDVLRELREAANLTQADMARACGLRGQKSHQTAGAWERGGMIPDVRRRTRFIGYLWDALGLRREPERFQAVWEVLVEEWGWEPIGTTEWLTFTNQAQPEAASPAEYEPPAEYAPIRRTLDVALYAEADAIRGRPDQLIGRDRVLDAAVARLDAGEHLLLHGLGGAGKTVLAATIAAQRLEMGRGPVIWIHIGTATSETIFTALVEHFLPPPERAALRGQDGMITPAAIAELLARLKPGLVVADDAWEGTALYQLMHALPANVPLLVTSRLVIPRFARIEVGNLAPTDAVALLAHYAGKRNYNSDADALALCKNLGFHAYALEIAGTTLELDECLTPDRLRRQIAAAPHRVAMPAGFAAEGRTSIQFLLDHSYAALEPHVQQVLQAFGLLYTPGATATLLATLLQRPQWDIETALRDLALRSLARQTQPGFYELHDLTFSYVQTLAQADQSGNGTYTPDAAMHALCTYVEQYRSDFATLELDQDNVLGAAEAARAQDRKTFLAIMDALVRGGYFEARGHTQRHLHLLDEAIALAAEVQLDEAPELRHHLLSKRGNACVAEGDFTGAINVYESALNCAPNVSRQVIVQGVIGKTYALAGNQDAAARCFAIATQLAEAHNDINALCTVLLQQSHAAAEAGDYIAERELARNGVELSKKHGLSLETGYFYLNLGSAEMEIGVRLALESHQQAYEYALRSDNEALLAIVHRQLGMDYLGLEDSELAYKHLVESLRLFEKIGHMDKADGLRQFISAFGSLAST